MSLRRLPALVVVIAMALSVLPASAASAATGRWSDPATWNGRGVPRAGQVVTIPAGRTVVLDVSPPKLAGVVVDGTLRFARRNLSLRTGHLVVFGRLEIGTAKRPFRQRAEIVLDGPRDANVMGMGANVLGAMTGTLEIHGAPRPVRWTRLGSTARAGARALRVRDARGWRRGDRIVVAATGLDPDQAEERFVTGVVGRTVHLDRALAHDHWGRTDRIAGQSIAQRAEVGLLSRNVVIRGGDHVARSGFGGHVFVAPGSTAHVENVELVRMGQAGVLARYPFHFHMMGSAPGSYFRSSVVRNSNNRCVTVHGTSNVTVADNVAYDAKGHCYFFEDGVETGVRLERNLGVSTRAPDAKFCLLDTDHTPATFWIQHPTNTVRGNAAAGSDGNGFWYDLPERPTGLSAKSTIKPREARMGTFDGNVAHTNVNRRNQFRSGTGLLVEDYHPARQAVFRGITAYKNTGFGVWAEHNTLVTGARLAENAVGFLGRDAALRDSVIAGKTSNNADKHWSMTGVGLYHDAADVSRVTFANFKPEEWRHGVAIGPIVEEISGVPRFSRVRFVNADRVRLTPPWIDHRIAGTAITDADGTVTGSGRPATITASHPLLLDGRCRRSAALGAHLCPTDLGVTMLHLTDQTGSHAKMGATTVSRSDGARYAIPSDPDWSYQPLSRGTLRLGHRYTVRLGRATPANLEIVSANDRRGWVEVSVPWPHENVHVYDGWGEWAETLKPASRRAELAEGGRYLRSGGTVTVRFETRSEWRWARMKVCASRGCGEGMGSRRQ